jgi:hypothetical protein
VSSSSGLEAELDHIFNERRRQAAIDGAKRNPEDSEIDAEPGRGSESPPPTAAG